jgi:hypothetical protein
MRLVRRCSLIVATVMLPGCASTRSAAIELSEGSCQRDCAAKYPDSLYDRNHCLEVFCSPP